MTTTLLLQTVSISTSLLAAGGIATLSLFDVPILQSQPASRSLPSIRWLFSRGSHIFPSAAILSGAGFGLLGFRSLPLASRSLLQLFKVLRNGVRPNGYLLAGGLCLSIAAYTQVMIPNNFTLIKANEAKGGKRSAASASTDTRISAGSRSALDSVNGKGEANQWTDMSGPMEITPVPSGEEEDREVREMLAKFGRQNMVRAGLIGVGGCVGLVTALM